MYEVTWMPTATAAILAAYERSDAAGQASIEQSLMRFHEALESNADGVGESRDPWQRIAFDGRCGIRFVVDDPAEGDVRILHFWLISRP